MRHESRAPEGRGRLRGAVAALALAAPLTLASPAGAAVASFHSPSGNIQCEVGWKRAGVGTYAYCQTFRPPRSVSLRRTGTFTSCRGTGCLGDGPEDAFTLGYGRSVRVGGFRCTSRTNGITCIVRASGRGFRIARQGLVRIG
jgi:hypothetical protein